MRVVFVLTFPFFLSSCCFMNGMFDERKVFENYQNDKIGMHIYDATRYRHDTKEDIDEYTEQYILSGPDSCQYAFVVDKETNQVKSWAYLSHEEQCRWPKFYCGAW